MPASNPFGVLDFLAWNHDWNSHHYSSEEVCRSARLMKEAGVGCVRMDFLWSDMEPVRGTFSFDKYDELVECLTKQGLEILGLLHYNPAWRFVQWNTSPIPSDYENYARAVSSHFAGRVQYWEIWNEPDHPVYWQPQDELRAYSQLLQLVYPIVKKSDPHCQVLMGGLTNDYAQNLDRLYEQAGRKNFDIVNIHPFVSPLATNAIDQLRQMVDDTRGTMQKNKDGAKPIWITEIGCPGTLEPVNWWLGKSPTEAQQADWATGVFTEVLQWKNIERIFWAFFRDTKHFNDGVDYFGLVRRDFSLKPAYSAYQKLSNHFSER